LDAQGPKIAGLLVVSPLMKGAGNVPINCAMVKVLIEQLSVGKPWLEWELCGTL